MNIEEIKKKLDIIEVVQRYIKLKRVGDIIPVFVLFIKKLNLLFMFLQKCKFLNALGAEPEEM
jgi:hypothetical protein